MQRYVVEIQYNMIMIKFPEMVREFLKQHHLNYRENKYMIMFEYKGHRIVSFEGGRMLIHGTTKTLDAIHLINQLFDRSGINASTRSCESR